MESASSVGALGFASIGSLVARFLLFEPVAHQTRYGQLDLGPPDPQRDPKREPQGIKKIQKGNKKEPKKGKTKIQTCYGQLDCNRLDTAFVLDRLSSSPKSALSARLPHSTLARSR